jgi:hypothetical protein
MKHDKRTEPAPAPSAGPPGKLTYRQCRHLLGGLIGCLCTTADPRDVRAAVEWWADSDQTWGILSRAIGDGAFHAAVEETIDRHRESKG